MKHLNLAFTLIEVVALIAITCLLIIITLPKYQMNTAQAQLTAVIAAMDSLNLEILHSYYSTGKPPKSLAGVSGAGNDKIKTLYYDDGSTWINKGAMLQVSVPKSIGRIIPGFIESTDGTDGAYNSIAMAFYDNGGTITVFCGRWDRTSTLYIPVEFLPSGCNNDNFKDLVMSNIH